jgi:homoserine/homoserine lactone efflux protein
VIDIHLYLVFLFAVAVLTLIPGPNMALIVANSVSYGTRFGMLTLAGTSSAMVIQLALTGLGMTAVMGIMAQWFEWIRWVGVLYLVWLGVRLWRTPPVDLTQVAAQPRSARLIYLRGLLVSLTNPKTLFFFGAFFPQFLGPSDAEGFATQFAMLSVGFIVVVLLFDTVWAVAAGRARVWLSSNGRAANRVSGGLLIGAGLGLALARRR